MGAPPKGNGLQNRDEELRLPEDVIEGITLADYPVREYSRRQINEAGDMLREPLPYTEEAVSAFKAAHNWRMAHVLPMVRARSLLMRRCDGDVAGRIKRMSSIRKKLRRSKIKLYSVQDLAGIRAIVDDMDEVRRVERLYLADENAPARHDDYIENPKPSGYRSVHFVRRYDGSSEPHTGMRVEIQIRTRLQHVWATAGEAIGAIRNEDLKASEGSSDWLRLLQVMSGHFAGIEDCPMPPDVSPDPDERADELREIDRRIGATSVLNGIRALNIDLPKSATTFLIAMDATRKTIVVEPKESYLAGSDGYFRRADEGEAVQSVLVSVADVAALRRAYPNYFLDIGDFVAHYRRAARIGHIADRVDMSFLSKFQGKNGR